LQREGDENASSFHEMSLIPLPEEKGPRVMDPPFDEPILVKIPDDQLRLLPFDQGETVR
jgi:hypothetical protein